MAGPVYNAIVEFFEKDDWKYEVAQADKLLRVTANGKNGQFHSFAQVYEDRHQFIFYTAMPSKATPERMQAVMEYITRANYGMVIGNFELDLNDGEVRYKTSIDVEGDRLVFALVRHLVYGNLLTADRYFPGLMAVMFGGKNAKEAIAEIEAK